GGAGRARILRRAPGRRSSARLPSRVPRVAGRDVGRRPRRMLRSTRMNRVFLETYGCQMNVADSETMAGVLERAGFTLTALAEDADAILINTCAIREHADQRVLGRLGECARLKAAKPGLVVVLAGCLPQRLRRRLVDQT